MAKGYDFQSYSKKACSFSKHVMFSQDVLWGANVIPPFGKARTPRSRLENKDSTPWISLNFVRAQNELQLIGHDKKGHRDQHLKFQVNPDSYAQVMIESNWREKPRFRIHHSGQFRIHHRSPSSNPSSFVPISSESIKVPRLDSTSFVSIELVSMDFTHTSN